MCNVISNRVIIGNFLIKLLQQDQHTFTSADYKRFDDILTLKLRTLDYYSSFDTHGISEFVEDYPYIISYDSEIDIFTIKSPDLKSVGLDCVAFLNYLFNIGLTKDLNDAIDESFYMYWLYRPNYI